MRDAMTENNRKKQRKIKQRENVKAVIVEIKCGE